MRFHLVCFFMACVTWAQVKDEECATLWLAAAARMDCLSAIDASQHERIAYLCRTDEALRDPRIDRILNGAQDSCINDFQRDVISSWKSKRWAQPFQSPLWIVLALLSALVWAWAMYRQQ